MPTLINGRSYGWTDVQVRMLNNPRPLAGITEVSWKADSEASYHHGAGASPVAYTRGKISYSGSMKLHLDEVAAIKSSLGVSSMVDLPPFDVVVSHQAGAKILSETLVGVLVTGEDRSNSSGGAILEATITFQFANIISK
jgi:hypothetical protein